MGISLWKCTTDNDLLLGGEIKQEKKSEMTKCVCKMPPVTLVVFGDVCWYML